ncbi:MAG: hypothetical protein ACR2HR_05360 [Euzebya sp.]
MASETAESSRDATALLQQSAIRSAATALAGQTLVMEWPDGPGQPSRTSREVVSSSPVPAVVTGVDPSGKYDITVGATEHIMDRLCIRIDVRLAGSQQLREQVWVDDLSGVFLRRETFENGQPSRSVAYLSLDIDAPGTQPSRMDEGREVSSPQQLAALRSAGWLVPAELPGSYELRRVYAHAGIVGMPLQAVYSDGLYSVSLFIQSGRPDLGHLPPGAQEVGELSDRRAVEWSGQLPSRMVWAGPDQVFTLVGDAPHDEIITIARSLPAADSDSLLSRVRTGLRRMVQAILPG